MFRSSAYKFSSKISLIHRLYPKHFTTTIPYYHRSRAVKQAQEVLTDYFHNTKGLPYTYAENISKHSTHYLYDVISKIPFSAKSFRNEFQKFLRYNPIDEFGFFYESIGIDYVHVSSFLKHNAHYFRDDSAAFDVACCLAGFGFPWDKLGKLYLMDLMLHVGEDLFFRKDIEFLNGRLNGLVSLGFGKQQVIGICLTFPGLLKGVKVEFGSEFEGLLSDLKWVFIDFDLGNVDVWYDVSSKVKVFYDLGVAEGEVGKLIGKSGSIFTEYSKEVLAEKVEFFSRLGVEKSEVGALILSNPKILSIKINDRVISVLSLLEHFGIGKNQLLSLEQNFKYVFGRNKMINLPHILRAMDLHEWFFHRMKCGHHKLFASYDLSSSDDGVDESYVSKLESIKGGRFRKHTLSKLDFLGGIGFGENSFTLKVLASAHGSPRDLQQRFDLLLNNGIEFCKLCKIISRAPRVLDLDTDGIKKMIDFFTEEIGLPLDHLETFPDLKTIFVDLESCMVGNVDVWFDVSRKIKVFYDLGVAEGEVGKLIGKSGSIFTEYSKEALVEKVEFISRLGVKKSKVGALILSNPKILSIKINDRVISVSSVLKHFGISKKQLLSVEQNFEYLFGRNKIINLPHILRAMNLHEWFFRRMECGYYKLFDSYDLSAPDDGVDDTYVSKLECINSGRLHKYALSKLDFFHGIGFGENSFTMKVFVYAHGSPSDLQERFDFLFNNGIEFCKLCKMINCEPKLLSQDTESIKKKLDFLTEKIGLPLDYLETFPAYLTYNLEKRIEPRYKFHEWLHEQGWSTNKYNLATIIALSHKDFLSKLSCINPNALQLWMEKYGNR